MQVFESKNSTNVLSVGLIDCAKVNSAAFTCVASVIPNARAVRLCAILIIISQCKKVLFTLNIQKS